MDKALLILVAIFFIGCSPAKQLSHLQKKHPYLFTQTDSFEIKVIPAVYSDTSVVTNKVDSFTFYGEKVITRVFRHYDTIHVFNEELPRVDTTVYITNIQSMVPAEGEWKLFGVFNVLSLVLMGIILLIVVLIVSFAVMRR